MKLRFSYLGKVDSARLRGNDITGKWANELTTTGAVPLQAPESKKLVVSEFVTLDPTPSNILAFTKRYAPLSKRPAFSLHEQRVPNTNHHVYGKGGEFSFSLDHWRKLQKQMQADWFCHSDSAVALTPGVKLLKDRETPRSVGLKGQTLTFCGGQASLTVGTLWEFMQLELDSLDPAFVKVCPNPSCNVLFVSKTEKYHGSTECKSWADRNYKRKWWNGNRKETAN